LLGFERGDAVRVWTGRVRVVNDWLERRLDFDGALHWLGHRWRAAFAAVVVLALLGHAATGLYAIQPDEVGLVRRFGRPMPDEMEPGLHWRWPWPVESVTRVRPDLVRTVEIGFRSSG